MARRGKAIGLALAGGGPEGAVWEVGALRALDEAIEGIDLNDLDVYIGVSAGAFLAANLANGLTPAQMCRAIVKHEPREHPFIPDTFFTPAVGEIVRRGASVPVLVARAIAGFLANPGDRTLIESLTRLSRALPVGVFDNEPIRHYLRTIYTMKGRTDDFRELGRRLFVVAADLERGVPVVFGSEGWDHVPISRAIQASSALPGLYPPVEIDGRRIVDGVLLKTLHASVALEAGAKLLFCINPIVPVDVTLSQTPGEAGPDGDGLDLEQRGLPTVLSQTFRTLIHSRLTVGMKAYEKRYRDAHVVLFEPDRDDYRMFFTNIFSFSARRRVASHAYRATRRDLLERADDLGPILARHGARLRLEVLRDEDRDLWEGVGLTGATGGTAAGQTLDRVDRALDRIEKLLR
ncbi:MAG TPA: patatin-like phospholipase family protein [Thermoanaerobaculia bacterium]|nr:patatin-like phospholipase family protein [Thermoanaerobaculia bacterium]